MPNDEWSEHQTISKNDQGHPKQRQWQREKAEHKDVFTMQVHCRYVKYHHRAQAQKVVRQGEKNKLYKF
jgi:hypothetical protein